MAMFLSWLLVAITAVQATSTQRPGHSNDPLAKCPGYKAFNVKTGPSTLTADLTLVGEACNVYGDDLKNIKLEVTYETIDRIHVKIGDAAGQVYEVPENVVPRPAASNGVTSKRSNIKFNYKTSPFSFSITRAKTNEVLFDTSAASLVFESQYLRLRTKLPENPNLYGLGEHSDPFRLNTTNYIRTLWSQDSYAIPAGANLYGNHPVYFDHRTSGSHGVFLLNSNGMDIMINNTNGRDQYLEYNTLGGVFDFYFMAGPTPVEVAKQYAEVVGLPAMMPYWGFGFHQCRYGYQDAYEVAEVIANYSKAEIPMETMWVDIDYMDRRRVFSLDPDRFPLPKMRAINDYLHAHNQKQIVMVDPAVAYVPNPTYQRGVDADIWLKRPDNGSEWLGVVWPGVTVFPDWFHENVQSYWNKEFEIFFSPENGVNIDGLWIDMNEPSNFPCYFPCDDPFKSAIGFPPEPPAIRQPPRPIPGFPCSFQPNGTTCEEYNETKVAARAMAVTSNEIQPRAAKLGQGLPGRDLLYPKYAIHNAAAYTVSDNAAGGGISNKTVNTDVIHQNGLAMYDTHNLYGSMMSSASASAMAARRPSERPFIITRSTFAGAGTKVGKWLGDNVSSWVGYRISIRTLLAFTSIYQIPMVGSDVCGFDSNTTEELCARWAMLGAFSTFYRNHNGLGNIGQEFYRWESVAAAARKAISIRYTLLDYIYTSTYKSSVDGTPVITPLFYIYPKDTATYSIELQYFYGPGLLISPVTEKGSTSVSAYLPKDIFYDFFTHKKIQGTGKNVVLDGLTITDLPIHYKGGVIIPKRVASGMTIAEVRKKDFELIVAIGADGKAEGELYLDDGISVIQASTTYLKFSYKNKKLSVKSMARGYDSGVKIQRVVLLGVGRRQLRGCKVNGKGTKSWKTVEESEEVVIEVEQSLTEDFSIDILY